MQLTILGNCVSLRAGNTVSKHKWSINCKIFLWLCRLPPDPLAIYSMKRIALTSSQGLTLLGFLPYAIFFSQSLINAVIFFFFYLYDKALILKCSLILSKTNIPKSDPKKSMGPYVAKMFFLQSRQMKVSDYTGVWYKNI